MAGTVLYVDDTPDLPEGLTRELGRLGFRLQHTVDCDEAFALARDGRARVLMVEVLLDAERGWDLIDRIRRLAPPRGNVPIVVLTRGQRTPKLYGRAVELGVDDFLARPVMRAEIIEAILECVELDAADTEADSMLSGVDGEGAASASLVDFPVPELLLHLREEGATGAVYLQYFEGLVVQLRNGSPIAVASSQGNETFADFLMRTKRISGLEHEALLERAHAKGESEPQAALAARVLSRDEVRAALADRAAEPLLEAFAWTEGSWRFEPGGRIRSGQALEGDTTGLLVRGVLQWSTSRSIRAMLDRRGALYLSKADRAPCTLDELPALTCTSELLDEWVGDQTVAQVLETNVIGEAELYALLVAGLVEARDHPLLELQRVVDTGPVAEDESTAIIELDQPCEPAVATDAKAPERPSLQDTSAADEAESAAPVPASGAIQPVAEPPDPVRARDAEWHFMEGEKHLAAKRYEQAVESFGMCAHLDPDQGEYLAHLGYAMHLQNPESDTVRREALEHIARGVKLSAERWRPLLYLARVFIAVGELSNARRVLRSAVRKHEDCEPLKAELRKLQRRMNERKPGLIARFRRWMKK
jgi:CheY-like chemotaxis protein/tetratricopeptide (TPR) repeat protein